MTLHEALSKNLLLNYQKKWLLDNAKVKVWEKSRRVGASYVEALYSVLLAALSRIDGRMSCYYLSYSKEMTQQFINDCAFWAKLLNIACGGLEEVVIKDENKDITVYKIRFDSGFEIWGLPSVPRTLRSKQGHVIIDEAGHCDDLSELIKAAMALLMWGGSVAILSTHNGDDNPYNDLIKEIRDGIHSTAQRYRMHLMTDYTNAFAKCKAKNGARKNKPNGLINSSKITETERTRNYIACRVQAVHSIFPAPSWTALKAMCLYFDFLNPMPLPLSPTGNESVK